MELKITRKKIIETTIQLDYWELSADFIDIAAGDNTEFYA